MEIILRNISDFFFYAAVIEQFICIFFIKLKLSRITIVSLILLNSLNLIILLLPYHKNFDYNLNTIPLTTCVCLILYPVLFSVMTFNYSHRGKFQHPISAYVISATAAPLLYFFAEFRFLIIFILLMSTSAYIFFKLLKIEKNIYLSMIQISNLFIAIYLLYGLHSKQPVHFILAVSLLSILTFYFIKADQITRLSLFLNQMNKTNELNRKLNHHISRLKQSVEQCKRIIADKDLELYQLSRHASLAEITTGIGHELTQPLTGIKGISQNMIDDINYDEFDTLQAVSELLKICSLVDKSSSIIDHIRNFSKKAGVIKKQLDLNNVILNAIDLINIQIKNNNIDIIFILDENIPKIMGDTISLEQLIINILLNSRDAIIENRYYEPSHQGRIKISTNTENDKVKLIIEDNGIGIPDDIMPKIWSPFFTSKKRNHGTGIGLSISSKILKDHDAKVNIKSDTNGTVFDFEFPTYPA